MRHWQDYLEENQARFTDEFLDFLRIPSISTMPAHAADVARAAEWVAARLRAAGLEKVRVMPTAGHPVVYGEWLHAPGRPTLLIYSHFDVQPPDPLDLWTTPPFAPDIRNGRVYARGAADMKGSGLATILAAEALLRSAGALPVNVKFLCEGEEEIGGIHLPEFLAENRELLACDMVVSADGGQHSETQPSITLSLRGGCALQIDVVGARHDLHSGLHGGAVQNPIHALVRLLDTLHAADGTVTVPGFYDDVHEYDAADRAQQARIPFDERAYLADLGLTESFGEPGYTVLERVGMRPTLEVNGIWGGFQGEGVKTIIPSEAHAKITCRLVADQQPSEILDLLLAHLETAVPPGVTVKLRPQPVMMQPYAIPADHPGNQAAAVVLERLYGRPPLLVRQGGSNAIFGVILDHLGVHTFNLGFLLADENLHAPDEFFRLSSFRRAQRAYCMLMGELGGEIGGMTPEK